METYPVRDKKPSRMFLSTLNGCGSHNIYCDCGRDHYCPDSDSLSYEDGDDFREQYLADILARQVKNPEGIVIHYDVDCVTSKEFDNKVFVEECPCNGLRRYEDWIWSNRDILRDYLKVRVEQEHRWAEQELLKNKLAGI